MWAVNCGYLLLLFPEPPFPEIPLQSRGLAAAAAHAGKAENRRKISNCGYGFAINKEKIVDCFHTLVLKSERINWTCGNESMKENICSSHSYI